MALPIDVPSSLEDMTSQDFRRNGHDLPVPFRIRLLRDGVPVNVVCDELFRVLPGKRVVVRAVLDSAPVLLKLFLGPRARRYREREARGLAALSSCGVAAPGVVASGALADGGGEWLALVFIEDARALKEHDLADATLLEGVMAALAKLHDRGVTQDDLHLGNFLLTAARLYAIDGDAVRANGRRTLDRNRSLENLALFFAQFSPRNDHRVREACRVYAGARGWLAERIDPDEVMPLLTRARERRVQRYLRKTLRECTEFHCERRFFRFLVCERDALAAGLGTLLDDLDGHIARGRTLKAGRTATVTEVAFAGGTFVVKRYNIKSLGHAVSRLFRPSRAHRAWQNAHRLRFLGVSDALPRALVERRVGALRREAYLVMGKVEGRDLLSLVGSAGECSDEVVGAVRRIFADLEHLGLVHRDTKASNFIVGPRGVTLIDLDAMRRPSGRARFERMFAADVERFLCNFAALPRVEARFREALERLQPPTNS